MAKCTVCIHSELQAINAALTLDRDSLRQVAARFNVSKDSVRRHAGAHIEQREPRQVSASQTATPHAVIGIRQAPPEPSAEPEPDTDRYYAFIDHFHAETATWGFDPEELRTFLEVGLECGDLP